MEKLFPSNGKLLYLFGFEMVLAENRAPKFMKEALTNSIKLLPIELNFNFCSWQFFYSTSALEISE